MTCFCNFKEPRVVDALGNSRLLGRNTNKQNWLPVILSSAEDRVVYGGLTFENVLLAFLL